MFPIMPREVSQFVSSFFFLVGVYMMVATPNIVEGCAAIGIAVWTMIISESLLLSKVQSEMSTAMHAMSVKREREVEDLLYFLREAKVINKPLENWEGAKQLVGELHFPAFVMGPTFSIIKANKAFTDLLGWEAGALDGVSSHTINDPLVMSKVGEICTADYYQDMPAMHLRYLYVHKTGRKILGTLDLTKIVDNAFLMVFLPDESIVVNQEELEKMCIEDSTGTLR